MKNPRILIVRPDRIGDVVLSTHLPREIRRKYPDSYISVLLREYTKDIYSGNPKVNSIITIDNKSWITLAKEIRKQKFDIAITLIPTEKLNWILFLAGIKNRIGVGHKFYQFVTNSKSVFRRKYKPLRHEADYCADHLKKLGIEVENLDSEIYLNDDEINKKNDFKSSVCPAGEKLIGINSTSGNSAPNMPADEYKKLTEKLLTVKDLRVAITDLDPPEVLRNIPGIVYPNIDKKLSEAIVNFAALDWLISSSTGPMHIAAALKIPTISLFCPLPASSPGLWSPKGNSSLIILPAENYCQNSCPGDPKLCSFEGSGGIDAEIVFRNVKEKLNFQ